MGLRDLGSPPPSCLHSPAARTAASSSEGHTPPGPTLQSLGAWEPVVLVFLRISPVPPTDQGREPASRWGQCLQAGDLSQGPAVRAHLPCAPAVTQPGATRPRPAPGELQPAPGLARAWGRPQGSPGLGPGQGCHGLSLPQPEPPAALLVAWLSNFPREQAGWEGAAWFLCKAATSRPGQP